MLEVLKAGTGKLRVGTATAVRGVDTDALPDVVNYDLPHVADDYVHRIGRTRRAGAAGGELSLVSGEDRPLLAAIEKLIGKRIEVRDAAGFGAERGTKGKPAEVAARHEPRGKQPPREKQQSREKQPRGQHERGRRGEKSHAKPPRAPRPPADGRLAGNSGGMDFSKPYVPSPSAHAEQPDEPVARKRTTTPAIPALFRRKAA